jgi:elongation factor P
MPMCSGSSKEFAMANIPLKRGAWIRHEGHVYEISDFNERHSGKQKPTVHVSLRDVRDGRPVDRSLDDLLPIQEVDHAVRVMQYTYHKGDSLVFMDNETFEECEIPASQLDGRHVFLVEGTEYRVMCLEGAPVSVQVPDIVTIKVDITAPPGHSVGNAANVTKEATLENGLEVRVPLFIKPGDVIQLDTRTRKYAGKDHA